MMYLLARNADFSARAVKIKLTKRREGGVGQGEFEGIL
jgi:hypothetical protein